ncbi:MAG: hypothetical protein EAY72_02030 [Bacteroidetes bacterium]|nr:MAG: hypothetical protein EAY72_02030 [Bacteroidota bacterium]
MLFVIDEADALQKMYPITEFTPLQDVFAGLFTIAERWSRYLSAPVLGSNELTEGTVSNNNDIYKLNAFVLPTPALATAIKVLPPNTVLQQRNEIICTPFVNTAHTSSPSVKQYDGAITVIDSLWDLVRMNGEILAADFLLQSSFGNTQSLPNGCIVWGDSSRLFLGQNLTCFGASFNTTSGPIVIGNDVVIMEGTYLRGPLYLGDGTVVKMGAKIYGGSFRGLNTLGGEIKNTITLTGTNKAHDGYLGDSYVGAWCNFGAGTTVSNVKNTAGEVLAHHVASSSFLSAGNKAGLLMGSFSRLAINSSINTGTVIGTCVNFFSSDLSGKFIPSFSWGSEKYSFEKAITHIRNWMQFKGEELSEQATQKLFTIYNKQ